MKYFVTGAAGFIGSNYVRWLLANSDHTVTVFDKLTYAGNLENIRDLLDDPAGRCRFVQGDICDRDAVEASLPGHDIVVHFAAESHVDRSIEDPYAFVHTNVFGTNVLCDVARRTGVDRFVHISTDETYGSIEDGSFIETDRLGPRSPYSAAKAGSDLIALSYVTTYGLPVVVTRCSNNYGPYQFPEKLIPLFTTNLLDGHKVPLYGDGGNTARSARSTTSAPTTRSPTARSPTGCSSCADATSRSSNRSPTASATTVATPSTSPRSPPSAGHSPATSRPASPRPSTGTARTGPGGSHSRPAPPSDVASRELNDPDACPRHRSERPTRSRRDRDVHGGRRRGDRGGT